MTDTARYLTPGSFIDSDSRQIIAFVDQAIEGTSDIRDAVLRLYYTIRDTVIYDPYVNFTDPANYRASGVLTRGRGFCIGKSALLAASGRVIGVPARVGYADVRNHLTSPRLYQMTKTDIFIWHSYTELYLPDRWIKATPVFDLALCKRVGLKPLEFDGKTDSLFQPFDQAGRRHMEYLKDRGAFADVPFDAIQTEFLKTYPGLMAGGGLTGDFKTEAVAQTMSPPTDNPKNPGSSASISPVCDP
jgi:transglutaminase-like putative cysteine protease